MVFPSALLYPTNWHMGSAALEGRGLVQGNDSLDFRLVCVYQRPHDLGHHFLPTNHPGP